MASKKRVPIGTVRPVATVGGLPLPGGGRSGPARVVDPPGVGKVWIGSDDPVIDVVARLTGNPDTTPPRPRYQVDERHGRTSVARYAGQDLLEQTLPIKFDDGGASIVGKINTLERLAEPVQASGEPPLVRAIGPGVRHEGLQWRVSRIEEDKDRASYADGGGPQIRYVATVTLTQHVKDELLNFTGSNARGIRNRTETVRRGEDSLHEFAKRVYGDRGKANDIARANPGVRLGQKLKPGQKLRIP